MGPMAMSKLQLLVRIPLAFLLVFVFTQLAREVEGCTGKTCSECITSGADCAWCADVNYTVVAEERCGLVETLKERGCRNTQNPETREDRSGRTDNAVTDGVNEDGSDAIQLQPQTMRIKVRPRGKGHYFNVTFRPANNFPVDLYFLFDLSGTMTAYIRDLSSLANGIAEEIGKISKNYRMGYGTFQDKVLLPFTDTTPAKLKNPCPKQVAFRPDECAPPFDYRHELNLTKNLADFKRAVNMSRTTGNIDRPEGGFDALMQSIVCKTVDWRDNSRQLIIFASDARMHFAGDGKLAGVVTPNDGKCHLDDGRTNSMSNIQDYPSVGQISDALDVSKKHVIFAVVKGVLDVYEQVQKLVPRSSVNELKQGGDSNILSIVRDKYRNMAKAVSLENTSSSDNIRVSITPHCKSREGDRCTDIKIGEKVEPFTVNIRAATCPPDPKDRVQTVIIRPSDFLKDKLNITVEIICDCDCQIPPDVTPVPSEECSQGNGTMECGICRCNAGRAGSSCECGLQDQDSTITDSTCKKDGGNSTTVPECSGVGECVCGVCECPPDFSGRYCQCNDKVCPVSDDLVCGGNGQCLCEECLCEQNFTGRACDCTTSTEACVSSKGVGGAADEVCSGKGVCECGKCLCEEGYLGTLCQTCVLCGSSVCEVDNYRECAQCAVTPEDRCLTLDCPTVKLVPRVDTDDVETEACRDFLTEECHVRFSVLNPGPNATLFVQQAQVCTEGPDIIIIVLGVVGGVVGVGLILLLLVKLLTSLFDRLEYQNFVKELQSPKWAKHCNPIYKEATTTYYNPIMSAD